MTPPPASPQVRKRAEDAVRRAVRSGKLQKPENCQKCGAHRSNWQGNYGIQAHHEDYDKPLSVEWLCPKCHRDRHDEIDRSNGFDRWEKIEATKDRLKMLSLSL